MAPTTRPARARDLPAIRTVVAHAVADDPMLTWLLPVGGPQRLSRIAIYFSAQVERLVAHGVCHVAVAGGEIVGAALWAACDLPRATTLPLAPELGAIVLDPERARAMNEQFAAARAEAPHCDGAYLSTLGVLDRHRGQGLGMSLVEAGHRAVAGPTWLETTNPRNHSLYERAGYRKVHEAPFADATTTLARFSRRP